MSEQRYQRPHHHRSTTRVLCEGRRTRPTFTGRLRWPPGRAEWGRIGHALAPVSQPPLEESTLPGWPLECCHVMTDRPGVTPAGDSTSTS